MDSKITINIVEPGSGPTPIDPVVPNTGLFTHGIGGPEATIIAVSTILVLALVAAIVWYCKKYTNIHLSNITKHIKTRKSIAIGLTALAILVSAGTFAGLLVNAGKSNTNAVEGEDGLTLDVSSEDLTIEVGDEPVFAVLPVELTVEEATQAGYTLTAYTDSTDLVSTTDESKTIPMVALDEGELAPLSDNTYGLALDEKPTTKDAEVYTPLSIDSEEPTILKATDYTETEANDTTTIYYGFYITPDVPYGTYTGTNINYNAEPHYITNLSFNGNGNDGGVDMEGMTIIAGDTITLPQNTFAKEGYNFIGWNTVAEPTEQDPGEAYADQADFSAVEGETKDVTLYAQWEEATLYMQDVAKWGSKLEIGDEIIAVDNRDNKEYYVARLADGNIWMTQNLDHDIGNIEGGVYTSTDTDLAYSSIGTTWAPSISEYTRQTSDTSWTNSNTVPVSYDRGDLYWNGNMIYDQATCEANGGSWHSSAYSGSYCYGNDAAISTVGNNHYHLGNYYNWTAAVAMSNSSSYTSNERDANQSICPAGWRLPKIPVYDGQQMRYEKTYEDLVSVQNLTAGTSGNVQNSPVYFAYGGFWNGEYRYGGSEGNYWSSMSSSSSNAYSFRFSSGESDIREKGYGGRGYGYALRCVAR